MKKLIIMNLVDNHGISKSAAKLVAKLICDKNYTFVHAMLAVTGQKV